MSSPSDVLPVAAGSELAIGAAPEVAPQVTPQNGGRDAARRAPEAASGAGSGPAAESCAVRVVDPQKVAVVTAALPGAETITELAQVFGLLADPGRLRVITALLEGGEMCVCDIAASCGHSESAVSHALRLLRANRVVRVRRAGRMAYYRLDDSHVRMLLDLALAHVGHGEDAA